MPDLLDKERAVRAFTGGVATRLARHARAAAFVVCALATAYTLYVVAGLAAVSESSGIVSGASVHGALYIFRDTRGIPHIRASNEHDAFYAEGYAQGSDRLFQMDLFRRYVYGRLSEIVGPIQLDNDRAMRALDVREISARQWRQLDPLSRADLQAFSDGVNMAMRTQPLPVEFRLLLYSPSPWKPEDCLAVTLAMSVSLEDTPQNVLDRDTMWRSGGTPQYAASLPLSDPAYDVSVTGRSSANVDRIGQYKIAPRRLTVSARGSNAWAAGGERTVSGSALIANDPHLTLGLPGVFYAVEMKSPTLHVAGVTVPGIPGVVLGHNEHIAWAATNAMASTLTLFRAKALDSRNWRTERFHVRFMRDVTVPYYRTRREFGFTDRNNRRFVLVRWAPFSRSESALRTVLELDKARNIQQALSALAAYSGPPQNFLIAAGSHVAYHLAGSIPNDPAWGRYVHPPSDLPKTYADIPFAKLPSVAVSSSAVLMSANNKMYGNHYTYRLSPMFAPPYRAFRIAALLRARPRYDVRYFAGMQMDTVSPVETEFAHRLAAYARTHQEILDPALAAQLAAWDGNFNARSHAATLEHELRSMAELSSASPYDAFFALRSAQPPNTLIDAVRDPPVPPSGLPAWGNAGAVPLLHPFGPIGFPFLNGARLPGDGDEYTVHVQTPGLAQSFRAVWQAGAWDTGGISMPGGESGEFGSPHYDDLSASWIRGHLQPLPFSDEAVKKATAATLLLLKQ